MSAWTFKPKYNIAPPGSFAQAAVELPLSPMATMGMAVQSGALSSFGLGTVVRDFSTPRGLVPRTGPEGSIPIFGPVIRGIATARDMIDAAIHPAPAVMTKEAYEQSPYFRKEIPFDPGMTEDRAAALAMQFDEKTVRDFYMAKRPVESLIGSFAGQALDPINYIPVFGEAAQVAAVSRFGTLAGRALLSSSEAVLNTAAFSLFTADTRKRFGDDVSFQAVTNEIAMSALIGGVFGAGVAAVGKMFTRGVDNARVQQSMETLRNIKESRAVLNEAVGALSRGEDVQLSPASLAAVERIQGEVIARTEGRARLNDETVAVVGSKAGEVAITPAGSRVQVRPEIVDAITLAAAAGDLQVRDRTRAASGAQIEDIAINLDPAKLMPSVDADRGAPIVGPDNIVDSGNGRVAAIRRAAEAYPEKYEAYKQALRDAGYEVPDTGIPILVNRRVTELSREARAQFNAEANMSGTARMSASELAAMDRSALTDSVLAALDDAPVTAASNRAFISRFLANIDQNERAALVDRDGALSAEGVRRVESALVAAAYGDVDAGVLRKFAEATDDNTRAIVGAMADVAGKWVGMRRAMQRGEIGPEFDITPELTQSLRSLSRWREDAGREGIPVSAAIKDGMAQIDMLSGEMSEEARAIIRAFYTSDAFTRAAGRETIAEILSRYADEAANLGKPQLFDDVMPIAKIEVIRNAANNGQGDILTAGRAVGGPEADGGNAVGNQASAGGEVNRQDAVGSAPALGEASILTTMRERFVAAGRDEPEADAVATLISEFYRVQAARLGVSPDALAAQIGLPEVRAGGEVAQSAMFQSAPAINTPEFKTWFGDSKVVDAEGKPLRVFHGTRGDIGAAFDPDKSADRVFWFTVDIESQDLYAGTTGNVTPVYLSIKNPAVLDYAAFEILPQSLWSKLKGEKADRKALTPALRRERFAELQAQGFDGIHDPAMDVWVAFKPTQIKSVYNRGTFDPADPRILYQPNRGAIEFGDDGQSIITLFETADASTALHETGHYFLSMFKSMAVRDDAPMQMRQDLAAVETWWRDNADAVAADSPTPVTADDVRAVLEAGTTGDRVKDLGVNIGLQEQWARGFEAYLREGVAPSKGLAKVFAQFKDWLVSIYRQASSLGVELSPEIKRVFDRLLSEPEAAAKVADAPAEPSLFKMADGPIERVGAVNDGVNAPLWAAEAAARVGKPETLAETAEAHGVDHATGDYMERGDVEQIGEEGRLTEDDLAELAAADRDFDNAEAYGRALEAAVTCIV